jgi:hypothetical protein
MKVVAALVPFVGMFVVFVVVLRAIVFGDRREREAMKRLEQLDAGHGSAPPRAQVPQNAAAETTVTPGSRTMQRDEVRHGETP